MLNYYSLSSLPNEEVDDFVFMASFRLSPFVKAFACNIHAFLQQTHSTARSTQNGVQHIQLAGSLRQKPPCWSLVIVLIENMDLKSKGDSLAMSEYLY